MVVCTYGVAHDAGHADADGLANAMSQMEVTYRHHEGVGPSSFFTRAPPGTQHATIQLQAGHHLFPAGYPSSAPCAVRSRADADGTVHVPTL